MNLENIDRIWKFLIHGSHSIDNSTLIRSHAAFVFGRNDFRLVAATVELWIRGLIEYVLVTGGIGKDSGDLKVSEAVYLADLMKQYGIPQEHILIEPTATNGAENNERGIKMIQESGRPHGNIIIVAHATSIKRLHSSHLVHARKTGFFASYQLSRTDYQFNPEDPQDQLEAIDELLRLADWPAQGWTVEQADLPMDLVQWARVERAKLTP